MSKRDKRGWEQQLGEHNACGSHGSVGCAGLSGVHGSGKVQKTVGQHCSSVWLCLATAKQPSLELWLFKARLFQSLSIDLS